jgi:hypothetical protein
MPQSRLRDWVARILVAAVFAMNVECAVVFVIRPEAYASSFELSGVSGTYLLQAMGILFLMWNATYPLVILKPTGHRRLFGVVIAQQVIGLTGESWLLARLPIGHATLAATATRFALFDTLALVALVVAFILSRRRSGEWVHDPDPNGATR